MTFQFEDTRPDVSSETILEDLRLVATNLGITTLPQNKYRQLGRYSSFVVKKRFGSWNRALTAAGLHLNTSSLRLSDEDLFDNLRSAWIALGRQPRRGQMGPPVSRFGHQPYVRRFGSWLSAMRQFVASQGAPEAVVDLKPVGSDGANNRQPSLRLRFQVMQRDGFRCVNCGRSPATQPGLVLQVDHVIPFSKGGRTELANLRTACAACNLGKSDA